MNSTVARTRVVDLTWSPTLGESILLSMCSSLDEFLSIQRAAYFAHYLASVTGSEVPIFRASFAK